MGTGWALWSAGSSRSCWAYSAWLARRATRSGWPGGSCWSCRTLGALGARGAYWTCWAGYTFRSLHGRERVGYLDPGVAARALQCEQALGQFVEDEVPFRVGCSRRGYVLYEGFDSERWSCWTLDPSRTGRTGKSCLAYRSLGTSRS